MTFYSKDRLIFLFEVAKYMTFSMCDPTYKVPTPNVINNPPAVISTKSSALNTKGRTYDTNTTNKRLTSSIVAPSRRLEDGAAYDTDVDNIGSSFGTLHLNHLKFNKSPDRMRDNEGGSSSDSSYSENKYRIATRKIIERSKKAKKRSWEMTKDKYKQSSVYVNTTPHLETLRHVIQEFKD